VTTETGVVLPWFLIGVSFTFPVLGLMAGLGVRLFLLASGLR
jgi:hypothetical protein